MPQRNKPTSIYWPNALSNWGKPHLSPEGLLSRSYSEYVEGATLVDMITEDLTAERIAIDSYREMVAYVGTDDPTTRNILEGILAQEEEHAEDLASSRKGICIIVEIALPFRLVSESTSRRVRSPQALVKLETALTLLNESSEKAVEGGFNTSGPTISSRIRYWENLNSAEHAQDLLSPRALAFLFFTPPFFEPLRIFTVLLRPVRAREQENTSASRTRVDFAMN